MSDGTKLYHELDWAAHRWDWFNGGKIVEPKSFCQFWRTVLFYATFKQFFGPLERPLSAVGKLFDVSVPVPRPVRRFIPTVARGGWFMLRVGGRLLWLLTYPLRLVGRPVVSPVLANVVNTGKRIDTFGKQHKKGLGIFITAFVAVYIGALATFVVVALLLTSWFWTLVGAGSLIVVGFSVYGFLRSGAPGRILDALVLLSDAALVAKHGICPPVRIIRRI